MYGARTRQLAPRSENWRKRVEGERGSRKLKGASEEGPTEERTGEKEESEKTNKRCTPRLRAGNNGCRIAQDAFKRSRMPHSLMLPLVFASRRLPPSSFFQVFILLGAALDALGKQRDDCVFIALEGEKQIKCQVSRLAELTCLSKMGNSRTTAKWWKQLLLGVSCVPVRCIARQFFTLYLKSLVVLLPPSISREGCWSTKQYAERVLHRSIAR